jgi:hypothetical protein
LNLIEKGISIEVVADSVSFYGGGAEFSLLIYDFCPVEDLGKVGMA